MQIIKKALSEVPREGAHGGAGGRRMYVDKGEVDNSDWQAMTYGYLPGGGTFDWHNHEGVEELMLVLSGSGEVGDRDGKYEYAPGDLFRFPADIEHMIHNPTDEEHEYIFIRLNKRP